MMLTTFARTVLLAVTAAFLVACTQTATSTYSGKLADPVAKRQEAAKLAARERAKKARIAKRAAFIKAREDRIAAARKARADRAAGKPVAKSAAKRSTKRKPKVVAKVRRSTARKAVLKAIKKKGAKTSVPVVKASYAAGAARRISTNSKPWNCVPARLKTVLAQVARKYGRITINSTHRSRGNNRMVGGRKGSYHLRCQAVDFRVVGSSKGLSRFLARHELVGGWKRYPSGFYHIDTGPKRTW